MFILMNGKISIKKKTHNFWTRHKIILKLQMKRLYISILIESNCKHDRFLAWHYMSTRPEALRSIVTAVRRPKEAEPTAACWDVGWMRDASAAAAAKWSATGSKQVNLTAEINCSIGGGPLGRHFSWCETSAEVNTSRLVTWTEVQIKCFHIRTRSTTFFNILGFNAKYQVSNTTIKVIK